MRIRLNLRVPRFRVALFQTCEQYPKLLCRELRDGVFSFSKRAHAIKPTPCSLNVEEGIQALQIFCKLIHTPLLPGRSPTPRVDCLRALGLWVNEHLFRIRSQLKPVKIGLGAPAD